MVNFGTMFNSGRINGSCRNHTSTGGSGPLAPLMGDTGLITITADTDSAITTKHPTSSRTTSSGPRTVTPGSGSDTSIVIRTPGTTTRRPDSSVASGSSPIKWARSAKSTPTRALPPCLPPPLYSLPPTPEASPEGRVVTESNPVLGRESLHVRKSSLKAVTKLLPSTPPTSFAQLSKHTRAASGSAPVRRPRENRGRSASASNPTMNGRYPAVESSPSMIPSPLHPRPPMFQSLSTGHLEKKHRPTALKLRTSNLTPEPTYSMSRTPTENEPVGEVNSAARRPYSGFPDLSAVDPDLHRPITTLTGGDPIDPRSMSVERRRSMSTGDARDLSGADETPRKQRSVPALSPPPPSPRTCQTPSTMSDVDGSCTPAACTPRSGTQKHSFENVPLPWSTVTASALEAKLGENGLNSLVNFTIAQVMPLPPRLLPPSILKTSASEGERLRAELSRLKEKYAALIAHRESLTRRLEVTVFKSDQAKLYKMVQAIGQTSKRCDRVARQLYICNDQIRQIEVQGEKHVVGALRLRLRNAVEQLGAMARDRGRELDGGAGESGAGPVAETDVTGGEDAMGVTQIKATTPVASSPSGPGVRFAVPESFAVPISPIRRVREGGMRISFSSSGSSRPMSTATVLNINSLSFPIPPERNCSQDEGEISSAWSSALSQLDVEKKGVDRGLEVYVERHDDDLSEGGSTETHGTISILGDSEIVIYPPGHHRSLSAPLMGLGTGHVSGMDMPHTPWRAEHYQASEGSIHASGRHERSASESDCSPLPSADIKVTEPLRLRLPGERAADRGLGLGFERAGGLDRRVAKSVTLQIPDGIKRSRLGRESVLETPESILLSLATAPLWTKRGCEGTT